MTVGTLGHYTPSDPEWILREDAALKASLQGLTVVDGNNPNRPVKVWFGMPDQEVRKQDYPYITIDLIDLVEYTEQVQSQYSGISQHQYLLDQLPSYDPNSQDWVGDNNLLPMLFIYQVASWARQPRHDREILQQLQKGALHPRFASVVDNKNVARRLIVRSFAKRDTTTEGKRLFRNVWTVAMVGEMFYDQVTLTNRVQQVILNSDAVTPTPPPGYSVSDFTYPGKD